MKTKFLKTSVILASLFVGVTSVNAEEISVTLDSFRLDAAKAGFQGVGSNDINASGQLNTDLEVGLASDLCPDGCGEGFIKATVTGIEDMSVVGHSTGDVAGEMVSSNNLTATELGTHLMVGEQKGVDFNVNTDSAGAALGKFTGGTGFVNTVQDAGVKSDLTFGYNDDLCAPNCASGSLTGSAKQWQNMSSQSSVVGGSPNGMIEANTGALTSMKTNINSLIMQ